MSTPTVTVKAMTPAAAKRTIWRGGLGYRNIRYAGSTRLVPAVDEANKQWIRPVGPGRPPLPLGDVKTSHVLVRLEPRRKAAYVKAASKSPSRKLSPWVLAALDEAAGYEPNIIPNSDEAARIVSIERENGIATVNIEWGGPNQRTVTDFDLIQLGDVVDCGDTPHASGGWVIVSGKCRKKVGSYIPYVPGESD